MRSEVGFYEIYFIYEVFKPTDGRYVGTFNKKPTYIIYFLNLRKE